MDASTDLSQKTFPANVDEKQILLDPIAFFAGQWPNKAETLSVVAALLEQRQTIEEQLKSIKTKTGSLSRQIGEAKRNKQSANKLIASMQEVSDTRKILSKQIEQVNRDILGHFTQQPPSPIQDKSEQTNIAIEQRYASKPINLDTIIISTFDFSNKPSEWNHYVSKNSAASIHHRSEWRDILAQSYELESLYLCARDTDRNIVGILPLIHMKSRIFGNKLVSMPFFQRGGAIADSPLIEQQLIKTAADYGLKNKIDYAEFRDDISRDNLPEPFATQTHKVHMVLDLPTTTDELWRSFSSKLRAQIKRPQREKSSFSIGGVELMDDFYQVYSRNMRDLGSPPHHKNFIRKILRNFPNESKLAVVYLDNKPVGGGLLLGIGNTLEIPLASTIRAVNHLSMNMLLYWKVLCYATDSGYRFFDFGRSTRDAATYRFKRQWGAQPKQLYWNYWLRDEGEIPAINPNNPKYQIIIWLWKRLPIWLANFLGSRIIRYVQ
jgi:serine/alanine adding enzyme